ncbi:Glucose-repressible protein [Penicillium cinerascens]|uniref:Glucose-repressible protein n=1 Tax=Penicillium cinerascens TaxID=70096 RepID=A0A9W9MHI4_9EURO|nr:Glucose-repressible protein [Penicillium cinerascens]KAJ5201385.1 Glucose-repressible protein [Penicillium cinerascens]
METAKNAANYVSESVQGATNQGAKEANKNVAKDSDTSLGTRASAAKDAAVNKKDETVHNTKADTNKEAAKH